MNRLSFIFIGIFISLNVNAQIIHKPSGCFIGTNGTNQNALNHPEAKGVLLLERWSNIESSPDNFNFQSLDDKIQIVSEAGLKFALAISCGAFGSPQWLINSQNTDNYSFNYQNQTWQLPLWWNAYVKERLHKLINKLGEKYSNNPNLSHVYVSQMTVNGVEGHLNGINVDDFRNHGFSDQNWISSSIETAIQFANVFPDKPIVFELHEIEQDTIIPSQIINQLENESALCGKLGIAMWWLSGKTEYQSNLLKYFQNKSIDKYAQVIGRSDQTERFKDNQYETIFSQAKELGIRYIEPWPYEFEHHTYDNEIKDFNNWASEHFSTSDSCTLTSAKRLTIKNSNITIYPNPFQNSININIAPDFPSIQNISLHKLDGKLISLQKACGKQSFQFETIPNGIYFLMLSTDNGQIFRKKLIKSNHH